MSKAPGSLTTSTMEYSKPPEPAVYYSDINRSDRTTLDVNAPPPDGDARIRLYQADGNLRTGPRAEVLDSYA